MERNAQVKSRIMVLKTTGQFAWLLFNKKWVRPLLLLRRGDIFSQKNVKIMVTNKSWSRTFRFSNLKYFCENVTCFAVGGGGGVSFIERFWSIFFFLLIPQPRRHAQAMWWYVNYNNYLVMDEKRQNLLCCIVLCLLLTTGNTGHSLWPYLHLVKCTQKFMVCS